MTATQEANGRGGARVYDFTPVEFDGEALPPSTAPGTYLASIEAVRVHKTGEGAFPMLIADWKVEATDDESEEAQNIVGSTVTDFLTFYPEGHQKGKMGKLKYRSLCEKMELPYDIVPKQLKSKADFEAFIEAITGKQLTIYVTTKVQNGEERTNVNYDPPRGGNAELAPLEDEEPEEQPRRAATKTPAKKTAAKSARR